AAADPAALQADRRWEWLGTRRPAPAALRGVAVPAALQSDRRWEGSGALRPAPAARHGVAVPVALQADRRWEALGARRPAPAALRGVAVPAVCDLRAFPQARRLERAARCVPPRERPHRARKPSAPAAAARLAQS